MSRDPRVDAYLKRSAAFAQPVLHHLRELVHQACPSVEETIKWSMPFFLYRGNLCHFAAFKAHCAFGFWHHGMKKILREDGAKADTAMGSFGRVTRLEDLPADGILLDYVRRAAKLNESEVPARAPVSAKSAVAIRVPADFAAALAENRAAGAAFANFSPSHRREYIAWITEAKRAETRQKRLATALEWLAKGKSRNWKYEAC